MAGYDAGEAYLKITPNYAGVVDSIRAEARKWGVTAGQDFAQSFNATVLAQTGRTPLGPSDTQSRERGLSSGGKFAEAWRTRVEAALKSLPDVEVGADTTDADYKLAELRQRLLELSRAKVGVDLDEKTALAQLKDIDAQLSKLGKSSPSVRVQVDTKAARAELAELQAQIDSAVGKKAAKNVSGLATALITLGPAVVPFAAGAGAAAGGLAAMGVAGVLAVKGIEAEMKAGTALGAQYAAGVGMLKADLTGLEKTASAGILSGFQSSVASLNGEMPEFNLTMQKSSQLLGDIAAHGVSGIVGGFNTFEPVIAKVEGLVDQLAQRFEAWATGPGGAKFAKSLSTDIDHLVPAVANLATLAGHLIAALNPSGVGALDYLTEFSGILNEIPVGVLKAATTAYIGFKAAVATSAAIKAASVSLKEFAGAEAAAAAGSADLAAASGLRGLAGSASLLLSRIAPVAAVAIGVGLAADQAANATESWAQSGNHAKEALGGLFAGLKDAVNPLKWVQGLPDISHYIDAENQFYALRSDAQDAAAAVEQLNKQFSGEAATMINQWATRYAASIERANNAADALILKQATQTGQLSKAPAAFNDYIKSLQSAIDADEKWTATGSGATKTLDGTKYSLQAWQQALIQANGDEVKAEGILKGHTLALADNQAALAQAQAQQKALSDAYAEAETRLKLTDAQVDLYASVLGVTAQQLANGTVTSADFTAGIKAVETAVTNGNTAMQGWVAAIATWNSSGKTAADRAQLLGSAMVALNGDALSYANSMVSAAQANQQLVSDMDKQTRATINLKRGTIDYHNAAAAPLLNDLQALQTAAENAAAATYQHELATKGAKTASKDAADVYYNDTRNALINEASQLGLTHQQAKKLADTYYNWPRDAKTKIEQLGADSVQTLLGKILQDLDRLVGKHWTAKIGADTSKAKSALGQLIGQINGTTASVGVSLKPTHNAGALNSIINQEINPPHKADGGLFLGAGGPRDDANLVRVSNREYIVNAAATAKNLDLLNAINYGQRGFESGGFTGVLGPSGDGGTGSTGGGRKKPDQVIVLSGSHIGPGGSFASITSLISGGQFGTELIKAWRQIGNQLLATTRSVTASMRTVAKQSQHAVTKQIEAAVAPAVTSIPGLRSQLSGDISKATTDRERLEIAKQNLLLLKQHAQTLDRDAKKMAAHAQAMSSHTKAERAAKDAAEKRAKAAQTVADAVDKMATRGTAAYQKLKEAAQSASQKAQQDAQALIAAVQSEFDTLQQNIQTFESGIQSGLTGGSDLATIWGNLSSNADSAKQALDAAQQAVQQAVPNAAAFAQAQSDQAAASSALATAYAQLQAAQSSGDQAAITAAQQAQSAAAQKLAVAQAAVQQNTPTPDQLVAQAQAQQQLADAQQAYNAAVQQASASGVADVLKQFAASEQQFASDLTKLQKAGAGQDLINQLASMGAAGGDALAQGLINDPASLAAVSKSMDAINNIAGKEGDKLAQGYYGAGVKSMEQLLKGIEKQFPSLVKALAPLAAELAAMFTFTPTVAGTAASAVGAKTVTIDHIHQLQTVAKMYGVSMSELIAANPSLKGDSATSAVRKGTKLVIPSFASGVEDFAGGLAYVHKNELLVNLPKGTNVYPQIMPASQLPGSALAQLAAGGGAGDMAVAVYIGDEAIDPRLVRIVQRANVNWARGAQHVGGDALSAMLSPHAQAAMRP